MRAARSWLRCSPRHDCPVPGERLAGGTVVWQECEPDASAAASAGSPPAVAAWGSEVAAEFGGRPLSLDVTDAPRAASRAPTRAVPPCSADPTPASRRAETTARQAANVVLREARGRSSRLGHAPTMRSVDAAGLGAALPRHTEVGGLTAPHPRSSWLESLATEMSPTAEAPGKSARAHGRSPMPRSLTRWGAGRKWRRRPRVRARLIVGVREPHRLTPRFVGRLPSRRTRWSGRRSAGRCLPGLRGGAVRFPER